MKGKKLDETLAVVKGTYSMEVMEKYVYCQKQL